MRHTFVYLILFLLFCSSCSNDEELQIGNNTKKIAVTVRIPKETQTRAVTPDPDGPIFDGTCTVDKVKVIVFSNDTREGEYTYDAAATPGSEATCKADGIYWVAEKAFTAVANKFYRVYAFAYADKDKDKFALTLDGKKVGENAADYASLNIPENTSITTDSPLNYDAPEIFYSYVSSKAGGSQIIEATADGDIALTGYLYRAVGKITIELTDIPADIAKVQLVSEKYTPSSSFFLKGYLGGYGDDGSYATHLTSHPTIASMKQPDNTTAPWNTALEANMIRVDSTRLYVAVYDKNDVMKGRYPVKCADLYVDTDYLLIQEWVVKNNRFTIPTNWHVQLLGKYETLIKSNLQINYSWDTDYEFDEPLVGTN